MATQFDTTRPGRVLEKDEAVAMAQVVAGYVKGFIPGVSIEHVARTTVRVADNRVIDTADGDRLEVRFLTRIGSGITTWMKTNQLNATTLRAVAEEARRTMTPLPHPDDRESPDPTDPTTYMYTPQKYLPVDLWRDTTITAMEGEYGSALNTMLDRTRAAKLRGAVTINLVARSQVFAYNDGLTAYAKETDCEVTMTARTPDGKASGWSGQARRDWRQIMPEQIAGHAVDVCERSKGIVGMEPGRKTAILSPEAVAQLLYHMPRFYNASETNRGNTPFSLRDEAGRRNKLFLKVMDERLNFISDPQDPEGGYPPFFEAGIVGGIPIPKAQWITNGILTHLVYDHYGAVAVGKPWNDDPYSIRMQGTNPSEGATVEEMIANCDDGVYVNRFSGVDLLDLKTGLMTGVTRDGCFHIKDGKINKPIKNYRFTDSPMFAFNSVIMIGRPQRVALGYTVDTSRLPRTPRQPIICPPMMIRDFNFSALSDAV